MFKSNRELKPGFHQKQCGEAKESEETRPVLPESLESIPKADYFPNQRHRWNTNEEIASLLISFERHEDWLSKEVKIRPKSGSMLLYSRKRVRYRRDGYCWKKRKDGKTTREDHMKLKVQGTECIYGCYVHSAILPTFHRRCYWLLQAKSGYSFSSLPKCPISDDNKLLVTPSLSYCADKKEWTKEELVSQLKPMFYSENEPDLNNELEISTAETVEAIVQQLMEKQRAKSTARTHECACDNVPKGNTPGSEKKCSHTTFHRIISPKTHSRGVLAAVSTASANSTTATTTATPASSTTTTALTTNSTSIKSEDVLGEKGYNCSCFRRSHGSGSGSAATSLILNLSQLQGGGGLLILNSAAAASSVGLTSASVTPVTFLCGQDSTATTVRSITTHTLHNAMDTSDSPTILKSAKKQSQNVKVEVEEGLECALKRDVHFSNVPNTKDPDLCSVMEELSSETKDLPLNLFEDSLAMSQDDIQRTLLANMPPPKYVVQDSNPHISVKIESPHASDNVIVDLNPMDFIDNDISTPDEEVFNMDTFDILSDLPNLDDLNPDLAPSSGLSSSSSSTPVSNSSFAAKTNHSAMDYREGTANITDYSPDWCYTEGGVKVLVTGPWYSSSSPYTILFDGVSVPTTLVQSGVLRCYSPAHETGLVTLQVACEGFVISNSVFFEYRQRQSATNVKSEDWFFVEDSTLKLSLLERLEIMETKLTFSLDSSSAGLTTNSVVQNASDEQKSFEDRLVTLCQKFMTGSWTRHDDVSPMLTTTCSDLTLLHLAAALGFSRLVCTLLHWRNENSSLMLEREVDAMSQDKRGCTPLMWACALGFTDVALLLYQWNRAAIKVSNNRGVTPLSIASERGHEMLVDQLEKLEHSQTQHLSASKSAESELSSSLKIEDSDMGASLKSSSLDQILMNPTSSSTAQMSTSSPKVSQSIAVQETSPSTASFSNSDVLDNPNLESQSYSLHLNESSFLSFLNVLQASSRDVNVNQSKTKKELSSSSSLVENNEKNKTTANLISDIIASDDELEGQFSTAATEGSTISSRRYWVYCETSTPVSSLSPASSSCLQSPGSFTLDSPSPPPTTADFCEFFQASGKIMEKDFSKLTLSDREQRELYEAAKIIQKAYRSYKGRKRQEEQEKEKAAATLIQTYYRRYKQYMYYKQMTKAAQLIQSQFRNYCEHKRFKKWKESDADCISPALGSSPSSVAGPSAASLQSLYWTLAESERRLSSSREGTPTSSTLKRTYSQRRQHQAARKIQQFLRQSKNKLQRERALAAEKEKQLGEAQSLQPLRLKYQEQPSDKRLLSDLKTPKCDMDNT
ncbi:calmodulin-binding transcription activator 2 [Trichonephila inaurata madagascariensis]|uniref:Calmodulin-binding transcription activator 2 n=1 Tax=Trichonephila inaurata madagascariensis TaxID=2747483 RepID=A0A8X6WUY4_9ARAC|nr:calmodulin-binding transcription activator 2 [Trichonephila inaurata madagascariensis]